MIRVSLPSQLHAYSGGASRVLADGGTVDAVMRDLDRQFPGVRFRVIDEQGRIRRHMRIFIGREAASSIHQVLAESDELLIFGALSGG
jgi:sulfur-carrier protein